MKLKLFIFIFNFIISIGLNAQLPPIKITHLGSENGLSQGSVYSIHKDLYGNMWFGTIDGLNFWDGQNMKQYYPSSKNKHSIDGIEIKKIIGFKDNDLLIGTEHCLNIFDSETEHFKKIYFRNNNGEIERNEVFPLSVIKDEIIIWVSKIGLLSYNYKTNKQKSLISEVRYKTDYFSNINTGQSDKNIWIHGEDGLLNYNIETHEKSYYFSNKKQNIVGKPEEIVSIHIKDQNVWIGTFDGIILLNSNTLAINKWKYFQKNKSIGHVFSISSDKKGNVWLGTEKNGLLYFNVKKESFDQISSLNNYSNFKLYSDEVSNVYVDDDGIIWANTDPYGIDKIELIEGNLASFRLNLDGSLPKTMQNPSIRTILHDEDVIWLGTQQSGLWKIDATDFKVIEGYHNLNTKTLKSNTIRFTHKDKNGTIWVGTSEGLVYYKNGKFHDVISQNNKMSLNFIRVIEEYKDKLWVGTESGIFKVNIQTKTEELSPIFRDKRISMIRFLSDSKLLIGIYNGGLFELNSNDNFKTFESTQILKDCIPISLKILNQFAWIGTSKGLVKLNLNTKKLQWFKIEDGLPNEFINAIEVDIYQNLWLSTNKGLARFEPKTNVINTFNLNDGLQAYEFNGYSSFNDFKSGSLYFGGINGLNYFKPKNIIVPKKVKDNVLKNNLKSLEPQNYQTFLDEKSTYQEPLIFDRFFINSFKKLNEPLPNFLYTNGTGWVKFALRNESNQKWFLEVENTRLSELEIWIYERNKKINYSKTGDSYSFEKYHTKDPNPSFELNLIENQQYEIYLKARTSRDLKLPIKIWNESSFSEHQSNRKFVWGIFIGFIVLISFYNLFLWITIKDSVYLYYMIYILSFGLFQFSIYGFAFQYFWSNHPFNEYAFLMFLYISYIFITLFTEKFLELKKTVKNWNYIRTFILTCSISLLVITPFWHPNQINYFAIALSLLFSILYYLVCYVYVKAKNPLIFYYALAIFFLTTASTILAFQNLGLISSLNQEYVLMTGSMFEIVLFSLALGYKYRQNILEKERQQQMRNEISSNLHDDLAASLSSLTMYTELSKRKLSADSTEIIGRLDNITAKSRDILNKVRSAVYEINPKNDGEEEWLERIISFGVDIFESKGIEFLTDIDPKFKSSGVSVEKRRQIFLIFKEAMNNAAKYSEAKQVTLKIYKEIGSKVISLKDNGKGISEPELQKGNGMANMMARAKNIQGNLEVITDNSGTEIRLTL